MGEGLRGRMQELLSASEFRAISEKPQTLQKDGARAASQQGLESAGPCAVSKLTNRERERNSLKGAARPLRLSSSSGCLYAKVSKDSRQLASCRSAGQQQPERNLSSESLLSQLCVATRVFASAHCLCREL